MGRGEWLGAGRGRGRTGRAPRPGARARRRSLSSAQVRAGLGAPPAGGRGRGAPCAPSPLHLRPEGFPWVRVQAPGSAQDGRDMGSLGTSCSGASGVTGRRGSPWRVVSKDASVQPGMGRWGCPEVWGQGRQAWGHGPSLGRGCV